MSKQKWLTFSNVSIPPNRDTGEEDIVLSELPTGANCVTGRDFNGHSLLWDPVQPCDSRGERMEEWISDNDLLCANDGSSTCTNRSTGNGSTPDLFLVPSAMMSNVSWTLGEDLGSDQIPIIIEIKSTVSVTKPQQANVKWRSKGNDWKKFSEDVEKRAKDFTPSASLNSRAKAFSETLRAAARETVRRMKPKKTKRPPLNPEIKALVKKRNMLRRQVKENREKWLEATRQVKDAFSLQREKEWVHYLEELVQNPDCSRMWKMVGSLSGSLILPM